MRAKDMLDANLRSLESRGLLSSRSAAALREAAGKSSHIDADGLYEDPALGVRQSLCSKRDPAGEARRQIDAWLEVAAGRASSLVAILGAGSLRHVAALAEKLPPGSKALVLEPVPEILAWALSRTPLSELERPGVEIHFAANSSLSRLEEEFRLLLRKLDRLDVSFFPHPASARIAPDLHRDLSCGLAEKLRLEFVNRETLGRFSREWILNSLANIPAALASAPAGALKNSFESCVALVAGAGPSLDLALEEIKTLKSSFIVIAAGTALKPLLSAGVEPDFVVAVDSDPKTLLQYRRAVPERATSLVCSLNVSPFLPELFAGRVFFFSANLSEPLNSWLEEGGILPDRLSTGGTVAVSAMDFARLLGCKRIVLCGVDLAMAPDGSSHSAKSVYAGLKAEAPVHLPGNFLEKVRTTEQFANYVAMVDNFVFDLKKRYGVEVFNASELGARIPNAKIARISGLRTLAGASPEKGRGRAAEALRMARLPGAPFAKARLEKASGLLEKIACETAKFNAESLSSNLEKAESFLKSKEGAALLLAALLNPQLKQAGELALNSSLLCGLLASNASELARTLRKSARALAKPFLSSSIPNILTQSFLSSRCPSWTLDALAQAAAEGAPQAVPGRGAFRKETSEDASKQVASWLEKRGGGKPRFVAALGFGDGARIEALAEALGESSFIFVLDPCPASFLARASDFDFRRLEASGAKLRFAVSTDAEALAEELGRALDEESLPLPALFEHPSCLDSSSDQYLKLAKALSDLGRRRIADICTSSAFSAEWLLNAIDNAPFVFSRPWIDELEGCDADGAAIVVGAGPSLDSSFEWLEKASKRACLICVGTALKSLLSKGIVPDFVALVDSDPRVAAQLDGAETYPFKLLAPPHLQPSLLERFKGKTVLFSTSLLPGMNKALAACGALPAGLRTGGTVALTALDAARCLGAKTIVLIGIDLAMAPDGRSHSSGSVYGGVKLERSHLVPVRGVRGGTVFTTPQFAHYVELLDSSLLSLKAEGLELLNLSRCGAALAGAVPCWEADAWEAISKREPKKIEFKTSRRPGRFDLAPLRLCVADLERMSVAAGRSLELCRQGVEAKSFSGAILAEMNSLDKALNSDSLAAGLCDDALKALLLSLPSGQIGGEIAANGEKAATGMQFYGSLAKASKHLSERLAMALAKIPEGA